ncbi:choice-of-anchor Q domain-containing protein [Marinicella sp. W31]|uniref:choice-of-anchor Q domain-containing protein n=1 Tax=Marinicella sp. W31 TaxID=3023713 RepID=UPI0037581E02
MKLNKLTQSISLLLLASSSVQSAEFIVQSAGDSDGGNPTPLQNGIFTIDTLRSAIEQADNESAFPGADIIRFDPSIFVNGQANIVLTTVGDTFQLLGSNSNSAFGINSEINIEGPSDAELTLSGNNLRHFQVNRDGQLNLNRVTLSNGFGSGFAGRGGAVLVRNGGGVNINHSTIANNTARGGGGLYLRQGALSSTVSNTVFSGNYANGNINSGGAINNNNGSDEPLIIQRSTFTNNTSIYDGGALFVEGATIIQASTIDNNTALKRGGGIAILNGGSIYLENSTISNNTATEATGGGIDSGINPNDAPYSVIINSTIANNQSNIDRSSAFLSFRGDEELNLDSSGGGLHSYYAGNFLIHNTLITNNTEFSDRIPDDIATQLRAESSHNLFSVADSLLGLSDGINNNQIGTRTNPIDAQLLPLSDNGGPTLTHSLARNSPAIDAGNDDIANQQKFSTDQRGAGFTRFVSTVDIGAVEVDLIFKNSFEE